MAETTQLPTEIGEQFLYGDNFNYEIIEYRGIAGFLLLFRAEVPFVFTITEYLEAMASGRLQRFPFPVTPRENGGTPPPPGDLPSGA